MEIYTATKRPKTMIFVIVYNRVENVKRWIHCWSKTFKARVDFCVIKNMDGQTDDAVHKLCSEAGVTCILRQNIGYDIGAFQDICRRRIASEADFDALIWCADDMAPMKRDWWMHMIHCLMAPTVGIASTHISWEVRKHCRTSGFAIRRETAEKLKFPADPITTKDQCYDFEHRVNTLHDQVVKMGLNVVQVTQSFDDLLWDTDHFKILTQNNIKFHDTFN